MRFCLCALLICALGGLLPSTRISAQVRDQFFEKDSAKSTFSDKVLQSDSPGIEYFPVNLSKPGLKEIKLIDKTILERKDKEQLKVAKLAADKTEPQAKKKPEALDPNRPVEEQFKERYGDPVEDQPILAMDNAPAPFQGMQHALQIGREDLAFQYARKYVRYLNGVQTRSMDVVGMVGKAMESEGLADASGWTKAAQFDRFNKIKDSERAREDSAKLDKTKTLDDQARELMRKEMEEETAPPKNPVADPARIAAANAQIPVDPKGEVDVFFFFRSSDEKSIALTKQVEAIYQRSKNDKKLNVMGLVLGNMDPEEINGFKGSYNASFPIDNGVKLAKIFGVRSSPTVAFVARSTGAAYFETEVDNPGRLEEVLRIMQGHGSKR